jgi:methyl coenzyme M reductase beta subunit
MITVQVAAHSNGTGANIYLEKDCHDEKKLKFQIPAQIISATSPVPDNEYQYFTFEMTEEFLDDVYVAINTFRRATCPQV